MQNAAIRMSFGCCGRSMELRLMNVMFGINCQAFGPDAVIASSAAQSAFSADPRKDLEASAVSLTN